IQTNGRHVITNPIAGTRGRGETNEEELALEKELLSDKKEIAEHRMLVDLSKNDLKRICKAGSVATPTYMAVEKFQYVMHMISEVHGELKPGVSSIDALQACL